MKNPFAKKSNILKYFLLGCANIATLTALSGEAFGNIIEVLKNKNPAYEGGGIQDKFATIKDFVNDNSFKQISNQDRIELTRIVREILTDDKFFNSSIKDRTVLKNTHDTLIEEIKIAPIERVKNNKALPQIGALGQAPEEKKLELGIGSNKPKTAIEENKILAAILKDSDFSPAIKEKALNVQIQRQLEVIPKDLDRIKTIIIDKLPDKFKEATLNNLLNGALDSNEVKHILFSNNFLDKTVQDKNKIFEYSNIGNTELFKQINDIATPDQREKLLEAYKRYVSNNFAEIQIHRPNDATSKQLAHLIPEEQLAKYLTVMTEITLDAFEKEANAEKGFSSKTLKEYNNALKEINIITNDLSNTEMQSLINGFNTKVMNKLGSSLENVKREEINRKLVFPIAVAAVPDAGVPLPPPPPPAPAFGLMGATYDIKNLKKINGLPEEKSKGLVVKLKDYYNVLVEFEKGKHEKQKEKIEKKAELEKRKVETKLKKEEAILAAEKVIFDSLPKKEQQKYVADKAKTQQLVEDYYRFHQIIQQEKKEKKGPLVEGNAPVAANPILKGDELTPDMKSKIVLGINQNIVPILRMILSEDIITNQFKVGFDKLANPTEENINILSKEYNDQLTNLFSADNPNRADIKAQAKSTYALLVKDKELNHRAKSIVADDDFFANLINEEIEEKDKRLNWAFENVPKPMQQLITKEKVKIATFTELENIESAIGKIDFIINKSDILGNDTLTKQVKELTDKFNDLSISDKIVFLTNKGKVNDKIKVVEADTLDKLKDVKIEWLKNDANISSLLINSNINHLDLSEIERNPNVNAKKLIDFYNVLAKTKTNLINEKKNFSSANISTNEITDAVQKSLSQSFGENLSKQAIVNLLGRIESTKLETKITYFKNQGRLGYYEIKDTLDNLKKSEKDLADKRKAAKDAVRVAPAVVVPAAGGNKEIDSNIGKKIVQLMQIAEAEAAAKAAGKNAPAFNPSDEQIKLKSRTQEVINQALSLKLAEIELKKIKVATGEECDEEALGRITKEAKNVLDPEYQGERNDLFITMESTLNNVVYKTMLEDEGLVIFLSQSNKDFIEKVQNVIRVVAADLADVVAPALVTADAEAENNVPLPMFVPEVPVIPEELRDPEFLHEDEGILVEGGELLANFQNNQPQVEEAENREDVEVDEHDDEDEEEGHEDDEDEEIEEREQEQEQLQPQGILEIPILPKTNEELDLVAVEQEEQEEEETEEKEKAEIAEEARIEEAKIIAAIEEAKRFEAAESFAMSEAVKEDKEMLGATHNSEHIRNIHNTISNIISNRMMYTNNVAVAAGEEDESLEKGIWLAGIYGTNRQKAQKNSAGYKGQAYGGTIGFDVGFNENDIVGIAYTKLDSKFKANANKANTTIDSHILALYSQKELPKSFMVQAMFAYNHNIVKSKINRLGIIATGKYKNNSYNFETLLNYNYAMNGFNIMPNLGVRYGHSVDGTYKESNVGIQHLSIASKSQNLWTGILGGKIVLAPQKISKTVNITPALHGSIDHYFNNKSKKLNAKVKWKDREIEQNIALPKQPKTGYNIGASVLAEKGNINLLLEYNCHLQKKYQSHQGFVKLKINF